MEEGASGFRHTLSLSFLLILFVNKINPIILLLLFESSYTISMLLIAFTRYIPFLFLHIK